MEEKIYRVHFELLDRYITFSQELLRISLLCFTGFGTLLILSLKEATTFLNGKQFFFMVGLVFLGICVLSCLGHRYVAIDSMACFVEKETAADNENEKKESNKETMKRRLDQSIKFLLTASFSFCIGILFFCLAIATLISN